MLSPRLPLGGNGPTKLKQCAISQGQTQIPPERDAESGTLDARDGGQTARIDADLAAIIDAWPKLPAAGNDTVMPILAPEKTR